MHLTAWLAPSRLVGVMMSVDTKARLRELVSKPLRSMHDELEMADLVGELLVEVDWLKETNTIATATIKQQGRDLAKHETLLEAAKGCPWFTDWADAIEEEHAKERLRAAIADCGGDDECDHKFVDSKSCLKCGWTP